MINPTDEDINMSVVYVPKAPKDSDKELGVGVIKSFDDDYVFVMFISSAEIIPVLREDLVWFVLPKVSSYEKTLVDAYYNGMVRGIESYAVWKEGRCFVGCGVVSLSEAIEKVEADRRKAHEDLMGGTIVSSFSYE